MNQFKYTLAILITLLSGHPLLAHPGHGTKTPSNPNGVLHYLTEPVHVIPFAAIALFLFLFVIGRHYLKKSKDQRQTIVIPRNDEQK